MGNVCIFCRKPNPFLHSTKNIIRIAVSLLILSLLWFKCSIFCFLVVFAFCLALPDLGLRSWHLQSLSVLIAVASSADHAEGAHWRAQWLHLQLSSLQPLPKWEGQCGLAQWRRAIAGKKSRHCLTQLRCYSDLWDEEETFPCECLYHTERAL